ncbi:hypothetical protein B0H14DRAFT_3486788 [Mycena olivaceomarginata]|nr:hypothetical protein B0H14DRAFT_3486788 [Mycena olivaceomarginata]
MALQTFPERFTHTPLFREYPWLSDAFLSGRWLEAATHGGGFKDYAEFLVQLDQRVPPANSTEYSDAEGRALLGLDNAYKVISSIKQLELLTSLTAKESKRKAQAPSDDQDVVATAPGSTADSEAWTLVQRLSGLNPKSLLQKTIKNLQAMGTALTWIIESRAFAEDLFPLTIRVNDLYQSTHDAAAQVGTLTVVELLRPLSYALNSSFMTVFCDLDLQKEFGNVMNQYETKLFLGRYRTPRLAFMEDVVLTVVRDIAIGTPVDASVATFLAADSEHLTRLPPAETADQSIFVPSDAENLRLAVTSSRKRTNTRPLPLTVPELPCSRVIATALATDICDVSDSAAASVPDWSALLTFDDSGDTPGNEGVSECAEGAGPDARAGSTGVAQVTDGNDLSSTREENVASAEELASSTQHFTHTAADRTLPAGASSKALYIRPREHESAEVPDSQIDVDRENPSVTEDTSPAFNAKEGGSVFEVSGESVGDESGSKYAEHADSDEQVGSSGVARVPDGMGLSNTHEENMDNNNGSFASSDQPSPHPEPDQAAPRIFSPITPDIRAPDGEIADVVDSKVDAERENRSVPEDSSPVPNATEGTSKKRPRSNSALDTGARAAKRPFASAEKSSGSKYTKRTKLSTTLLIRAVFDEVFRQGGGVKSTVDSTAHPLEPPEKAERKMKSSKRRKPSKRRSVASKTRKPDAVAGPLSEVESTPPKISLQRVPMWGFRPDGSKREFEFQLHENSEHAEGPMLQQLQHAIERQQQLCGGRAFVRHEPGQMPTEKPRVDEPALYVLTETEWKALSALERTALYQTGRNIFIMNMVIGELVGGVEESLSVLHRLDEVMEVQVPGLRLPPKDGVTLSTDYSDINRRTTLRPTVIPFSACKPIGRLSYPLCSGLDLEEVAYRQTAGLFSFGAQTPPNEKKWFDIAGTKWTMTLPHLDAAGGTIVGSQGAGEKYWITKRDDTESIHDSQTYRTWNPDEPDFESGRYEGIVLPPRGGVFLMQNVEHVVLGLPPHSETYSRDSFAATWISGGHYFAASRVRPALSVHLHLVMLQHVLTNVDHDAQWQILTRISAFWLDLTSVRPAEDTVLFAPYLPTLDEHSTKGWMDIVCIACLVVLSVCFDRRGYLDFIPQEELLQREHDSIPQEELLQREQVISMYRRWRRWFTVKYVGRKGDAVVDWEADVFTPALLHLARVLLCYHEEERSDSANSESDGLVRFSGEVVKSKVVDALESYSSGLGAQLSTPPQHSRFWLFSGDEFTLHALF